jgi:hypothetical protein
MISSDRETVRQEERIHAALNAAAIRAAFAGRFNGRSGVGVAFELRSGGTA